MPPSPSKIQATFTVRLDPVLAGALHARARSRGCTPSAEMRNLVVDGLSRADHEFRLEMSIRAINDKLNFLLDHLGVKDVVPKYLNP